MLAISCSIGRSESDMFGIYFCGVFIAIIALLVGDFLGSRKKRKTSVDVENS